MLAVAPVSRAYGKEPPSLGTGEEQAWEALQERGDRGGNPLPGRSGLGPGLRTGIRAQVKKGLASLPMTALELQTQRSGLGALQPGDEPGRSRTPRSLPAGFWIPE